MSCVICARISTVRPTRKWANWASFSGLAAILQMPIRGLLICLKRSLIPQNGLAQFFTCDWVAPIDKLTERCDICYQRYVKLVTTLMPFDDR